MTASSTAAYGLTARASERRVCLIHAQPLAMRTLPHAARRTWKMEDDVWPTAKHGPSWVVHAPVIPARGRKAVARALACGGRGQPATLLT
eukprot:3708805-Prymnesium_polylepis.2